MTFIQKPDLNSADFTNNSTAGAGGIALRTGPGSTLQAQIEQAGNGIYAYPGPLQPTHGAPNATNPQQFAQNGNGELFRFTTSWVLIGDGLLLGTSQPALNLPSGAYTFFNTIITPRNGIILITASTQIVGSDAAEMVVTARKNGVPIIELNRVEVASNSLRVSSNSAGFIAAVAQGDVFDIAAYQAGATSASVSGSVNITYIR